MAARRNTGGIFGVLELLDKYEDEIEYDLLSVGLDLYEIGREGARTTWRHVLAVTRCHHPDTALARAIDPERAAWQVNVELLAQLQDTLSMLAWNLGGQHGAKPKRIPRPGTKGETTTYGGGESWTPESFDLWLDEMTEN